MSQTFITQAVRNLSIAIKLSSSEKEWSIFLCHQSAELAMKSLLLALGQDWRRLKDPSHNLTKIWSDYLFSSKHIAQTDLSLLDGVYIDTRYPGINTPEKKYASEDVTKYIKAADRIVRFCQKVLPKFAIIRTELL